jgi:hypothetical protein
MISAPVADVPPLEPTIMHRLLAKRPAHIILDGNQLPSTTPREAQLMTINGARANNTASVRSELRGKL